METFHSLDFNVLAYLHHIEAITNLASADDKMVIFLDCEGRDLGPVDGKLGLIQLGIESEIYFIDVIALPIAITIVKEILEDHVIEKVMWDGRSDYADLWHGHGIDLNPVIDLQLVQVYRLSRDNPGPRGFITLTGMSTAFSKLNFRERVCVDLDGLTTVLPPCWVGGLMMAVHEAIKYRHHRDETAFWVSRLLDSDLVICWNSYALRILMTTTGFVFLRHEDQGTLYLSRMYGSHQSLARFQYGICHLSPWSLTAPLPFPICYTGSPP